MAGGHLDITEVAQCSPNSCRKLAFVTAPLLSEEQLQLVPTIPAMEVALAWAEPERS